MLADVILAAAELQVAGEHAGLDPADVFWVLERFVPRSPAAGYLGDIHTPQIAAPHKDPRPGARLVQGSSWSTPVDLCVERPR